MQADRLMADIEWTQLVETLRARKLLGVLGPRILELSEGRPTSAFALAVEQALAGGRRQGAFLQLISLRAVAMLAEAGIRSSALKGPILGEAIHGDLGRRLSNDIDLLVASEELDAAVEVVRHLGYGDPAGHVLGDGLPLLHFLQTHEQGLLPPIELHWRIHWYESSFARERLLPATVDPSGDWRPAPVDELAALLLFYARDGFIDLRIASDLSAWWDIYGNEVPYDGLDSLLDVYPALARVIPTAALVAERIVGLPLSQMINKKHAPDSRGRIAARLANPNPRSSTSQLYADMGLIDGLLAPPGGFRAFVRRQLLPPSEVLDQQARHASRRRARSPLSRGMGMLGRYALAMTRLVRTSETPRSN